MRRDPATPDDHAVAWRRAERALSLLPASPQQNDARLPWFDFESPSAAIGGAYGNPDTSLLSAPFNPQNFMCQ